MELEEKELRTFVKKASEFYGLGVSLCFGCLALFSLMFVIATASRGAVVEFTLFASSPAADSCLMNGLKLNGKLSHHYSIRARGNYELIVGGVAVEVDHSAREPVHKCGILNSTFYTLVSDPEGQTTRQLEKSFLEQTYPEIFAFFEEDPDALAAEKSIRIAQGLAVILPCFFFIVLITMVFGSGFSDVMEYTPHFWTPFGIASVICLPIIIGFAFLVYRILIHETVSNWDIFTTAYDDDILGLGLIDNSTFLVIDPNDFSPASGDPEEAEFIKRLHSPALCTGIYLPTIDDSLTWTEICAEMTGKRLLRYTLALTYTCLILLAAASLGFFIMTLCFASYCCCCCFIIPPSKEAKKITKFNV